MDLPSIRRNRLRTRSRLLRGVIVVGLALSIARVSAAPGKSALIGKPAPPFTRTNLDSHPVDLATLRGRVVLLNFWATWCAGCKVEMPRFVQWQDRYGADGLSIVGVSMDDDSQPVKVFLRKRPVNYPVVMGDERLGLAYGGVLGLPVTYLIDRNGVIRARYQGAAHLDVMETAIHKLLNSP